MNKKFNKFKDLDRQDHPHQEGQQQNIAKQRTGKGSNSGNDDGRNPRSAETESDRANKNEDQGVRGGNSSV